MQKTICSWNRTWMNSIQWIFMLIQNGNNRPSLNVTCHSCLINTQSYCDGLLATSNFLAQMSPSDNEMSAAIDPDCGWWCLSTYMLPHRPHRLMIFFFTPNITNFRNISGRAYLFKHNFSILGHHLISLLPTTASYSPIVIIICM